MTRVDTTNTTIVNNTYVNRNVTIVDPTKRVSYNGGAHGLVAHPTSEQAAIATERHLPMTAAQVRHLQVASQDRRLLATVNHAHPAVLAVARPLGAGAKPAGFVPVRATDRIDAQSHAVAAAHAAPVYHAPVETPASVGHAPAPAYHAPAPAYHAPLHMAHPSTPHPPVQHPHPTPKPDDHDNATRPNR